MSIWLILFSVLSLITLFFRKRIKNSLQTITLDKQAATIRKLPVEPQTIFPDNGYTPDAIEKSGLLTEGVPWKDFSSHEKICIAVILAKMALPVWEKYLLLHDAAYSNSPTSPLIKINSNLLKATINEIKFYLDAKQGSPYLEAIRMRCNEFVAPLIAIHDGTWVPPYPVKKIFTALYFILKGASGQDEKDDFENFLAAAVNELVQCVEVSNLYSKKEISVLMADFSAC